MTRARVGWLQAERKKNQNFSPHVHQQPPSENVTNKKVLLTEYLLKIRPSTQKE
jgi:hypothetical protein